MKKLSIFLMAVLVLTALLSGCQNGSQPAGTDTPIDTSSLLSPSASATAAPTASASTSAAPSQSGAISSATPSTAPSVTPNAGATVAPATTYAELDPGYTILTSLAKVVSESDYIILCTVKKDLGTRNLLDGTPAGELSPSSVISNWEYTLTVKEVLKTAGDHKISADSEILYSMPFEIKTKKKDPIAREQPFVQLQEGKDYVLMLTYDEFEEFYTQANFDPSKFEVDGDNLVYISGIGEFFEIWETVIGGKTLAMSELRKAVK